MELRRLTFQFTPFLPPREPAPLPTTNPHTSGIKNGDLFAASWPVIDLTPQIVLEAARGVRDHGLAYYDSQIWAAAWLNQIPIVFSEDFQDEQLLEGVRFVDPFAGSFDMEAWL